MRVSSRPAVRTPIALCCALASAAAAAQAAGAQTTAAADAPVSAAAPPPAEDSRFIRVVDQADRGEMVFLVGPVDLPAGASPESGHHVDPVPLQEIRFPRAGWVHGFAADFVDAAGAPLRETFLHHVNVIDPDHRELFSPIARRVMAAGPETGEKELPSSMGLPIEAGQRLLVRAVFHNPTPQDREDLFLRIRFDFEPSRAGSGRAGVFPLYLDVRPPVGKKSFDLPPGLSEQSWTGRPAVAGRLLAAAGHLHRYAVGLRLEDATEGKVLWEVAPVIDSTGQIEEIPIGSFWKKGGIPLRPDREYRLTATYDNPTGETLPDGGMGTLGGVFIPEPGETWPELDTANPDYLADLVHQRGGTGDMAPGGPHGGHAAAVASSPAPSGSPSDPTAAASAGSAAGGASPGSAPSPGAGEPDPAGRAADAAGSGGHDHH
jgi:hypothetical protein